MIGIESLLLLRPLWLVGLPAALLLGILVAQRIDGLTRWHRVINPKLMPVLRRLAT